MFSLVGGSRVKVVEFESTVCFQRLLLLLLMLMLLWIAIVIGERTMVASQLVQIVRVALVLVIVAVVVVVVVVVVDVAVVGTRLHCCARLLAVDERDNNHVAWRLVEFVC